VARRLHIGRHSEGKRFSMPIGAASRSSAATTQNAVERGFSLVLGGPLYQFFRRARLSDDALGLVHRRIVFAVLVMWVPLVVFSAAQGGLAGPGPRTTFLADIGFQLRFLVVTPLLLLDELVVHRRMRPIIDQFRIRGLLRPDDEARFDDAVAEAELWRNSVVGELALLALVLVGGLLFTIRRYVQLGAGGWLTAPSGGALSLAGLWLVFVSIPLLQFLLLRWYYRLFIWARFLWRVSWLDLDLDATHPDKAGGLGFLSESLAAFIPIALAHGVLFAGMIADRILFAGATLPDFQLEVVSGAVLLVLVFAGPLTVFAPRLERVKRAGLREYGALGQVYVREFRDKWLKGRAPADEPLLGSGDIQSLADLGNSYSAAEQMRLAPIKPSWLIYFVAAFLAPIAPLLLTMMPMEKLVGQLVGLVF
jgi:hypothetical protein